MARKKTAAAGTEEQVAFENGQVPPRVEGVVWTTSEAECNQEFLLPGFVPKGHLVILEGRKGTGKTTFAASLAACVTGGPMIPGYVGPRSGRVLWVPSEESYRDVSAARLAYVGAVAGRFGTWEVPEEEGRTRRPVLPDDVDALRDIIWRAHIVLLVLDPFASLKCYTLDLTQESAVRAYLDPLAAACHETGCTALLLRNVKKGLGGDVRDAGRGSGSIGDVARSVIRCDEHPHEKETNTLSSVAINFGRRGNTRAYRLTGDHEYFARIEWLGECALDADSIAEGRGSEADRDEWSDADRLLAMVLKKGWCNVEDVLGEAEQAGVTPRMMRRAKARLKVPSRRKQKGAAATWQWGPPQWRIPRGTVRKARGYPPPARGGRLAQNRAKKRARKPGKTARRPEGAPPWRRGGVRRGKRAFGRAA